MIVYFAQYRGPYPIEAVPVSQYGHAWTDGRRWFWQSENSHVLLIVSRRDLRLLWSV